MGTASGRPGKGRRTTTVYLVRHGRTALNAAGLLRGHLDPPLDRVGRREAGQLAAVFAPLHVGAVVASPLARAQETASAIAAACGLPLEVDERLVDREYGEWAGKEQEEVEAAFGSVDAAPGVEPAATVRERAMEALTDVAGEAAGTAAVVVSHDVVLKLCLAACDPHLGDPARIRQATGRFNTLELRSGRWRVLGVNQDPARSLLAGRAQ